MTIINTARIAMAAQIIEEAAHGRVLTPDDLTFVLAALHDGQHLGNLAALLEIERDGARRLAADAAKATSGSDAIGK